MNTHAIVRLFLSCRTSAGLLLRYLNRPLCLLLFIIAACAPKPVQKDVPAEVPEAFSLSGEATMPDRWWQAFGDQRLNALVDTSLQDNLNLLTAYARLEAAEAVVRRESSSLFPQVDAGAQGGISRPEPDFVGGENVRLGFNAAYELDLWGRIRASRDAEIYRARATLQDFRTASLSLTAEVVRTWFQLQAAWTQLRLAEDQIANNEKILELIAARFRSGMVRGVDLLRQRQLLESTRDLAVRAESRVAVLEHRLAILLGRPPRQPIAYEPDTLPSPPPLPETGLPAELVTRRPDIRQAYAQLQAADRDVAVAVTAQYPRFTITTSLQARSNNFENLFNNWAYSLGGNLLAPLFYGGRLSAEVDRTEAVMNQQLNQYGQAVLVAFREVEDALVQEQKQKERIEIILKQVELSRRAYEQLQVEYIYGFSDYLDVLTAQNTEQQLRRDLVEARLALLEFRIALYRALAGGFETRIESEES
ncbi:efflux transporter outer membrane subunit [Roseivirga sp. BDSF3-8]|uniref:efflux transporter outer membrane subunit n=1 Tax=Roseivirga sp. BDSF3-8 TaxID=3241598 RepID=UPI0035324B91